MLKYIYLLIVIFTLTVSSSFGQCYIDSLDGNFGFNPGNRAWVRIYQGKPYSFDANVYMPTSSTPFTFYYLIIDTITNLPQGITYARNPNSDTLYAGGHQCYEFSGITTVPIGPYGLDVQGTVYYSAFGSNMSTSISNLSTILALIPSGFTTGFNDTLEVYPPLGVDNAAGMASQVTVSPNPNNGKFDLQLDFPFEVNTASLTISDFTGRTIYTQDINADGVYKTSIDLGPCPKGMYIAGLKTSAGTIVKKIVIQ